MLHAPSRRHCKRDGRETRWFARTSEHDCGTEMGRLCFYIGDPTACEVLYVSSIPLHSALFHSCSDP